MMILAVSTALSLGFAPSLLAANPAGGTNSGTEQAGESKEAAEEKKICRRTINVGSRFPTKVCATPAEWREMNRKGAENAAEAREQGGRGS